MSATAIINIGTIVSGDLERGILEGDAILIREGKIAQIRPASTVDISEAQTIIDAQGTTVLPGLIDSRCLRCRNTPAATRMAVVRKAAG